MGHVGQELLLRPTSGLGIRLGEVEFLSIHLTLGHPLQGPHFQLALGHLEIAPPFFCVP